jgi:hypothetical protein
MEEVLTLEGVYYDEMAEVEHHSFLVVVKQIRGSQQAETHNRSSLVVVFAATIEVQVGDLVGVLAGACCHTVANELLVAPGCVMVSTMKTKDCSSSVIID